MFRKRGSLEEIRIAEPCHAAWDRMDGDDRIRFCGECRRNVYNLSAMGRAEAERLVYEAEGRICVRFYQRRDGTVLTDNCPVGLRDARRWLKMQLVALAASFAGVLALAPWNGPTRQSPMMGDVAMPTTPPVPKQPLADVESLPVEGKVLMGSPPPAPPQKRTVPTRNIPLFVTTGELTVVQPRREVRMGRHAVQHEVPLPPVMGEVMSSGTSQLQADR